MPAIIHQVATVVPAEGGILERVLDATHATLPQDLSREAYTKFDAVQKKTAWGRDHLRRFALVDGGDVLASATLCDLVAVLDQRPVRVCGIGGLCIQPGRAGDHTRELVERLLDQAARDGAVMALPFSDMSHEHQPTGFDVVAMTEAQLRVAESSRRGAPMTLIRGGEERDLAAIVAPSIAIAQRADEQPLVRLRPVGVVVGELLEQVHCAHGHEPIRIVRESGHIGEQIRVLLEQYADAIRLRDRSSVASGKHRSKVLP